MASYEIKDGKKVLVRKTGSHKDGNRARMQNGELANTRKLPDEVKPAPAKAGKK